MNVPIPINDNCYESLIGLLDALQERARNQGKHILLFVDEMMAHFFMKWPGYENFKRVMMNYKCVHLYMAVNPAGDALSHPLNIGPFIDNSRNLLTMQLQTRHRNSFQIAAFLVHLTYLYNDESFRVNYKCLSPTNDEPLDRNKLIEGDITRWFHCNNGMKDTRILTHFKEFDMIVEGEPFLVSPIDNKDANKDLQQWCLENGAEYVTHANMMGSERESVFAFIGDKSGNIEIFSRARKFLVIISRYRLFSIAVYSNRYIKKVLFMQARPFSR